MIAYQPSDNAADLLPAAWYQTAEQAEVPGRHRVLGCAVLLIAVGFSLAAPVAGAIAVTAGITVLRAAERAAEWRAARRAAREPRRSDPFLLLASMPWMMVEAAAETILLAPFGLLAAAIPVAAAMTATGGGHLALAVAAVAAGYTVMCCLGPGSRAPRGQLNRFLDVAARTPSRRRGRLDLACGPFPTAHRGDEVTSPRQHRFRWVKRLYGTVLALVALGAITFTGLMLVLPGVGDAPAVARAMDRARHAADPGSALPPRVAAALVATEDHRFYSEPGVDPAAAGREVLGRLSGGPGQGAATLDQQLARMLYVPGRSGLLAEAEQVLLGVKLDLSYSKARILQLYADVAYFGHGYYGVAAASCGYFAQRPARLSWGQAAMLAGLVQAPAGDDPLSGFANARAREAHVLARLINTGKLTPRQASAAYQLPLHLTRDGTGRCARS